MVADHYFFLILINSFWFYEHDSIFIWKQLRGRRPLRLQQMYYAALDAFVGLELYERLQLFAEEKSVSSDRSSSTFLNLIMIFDAQVDEGADWTSHWE